MSAWVEGISAAISLLGASAEANAQQKAIEQQMAFLKQYYAPDMAAKNAALGLAQGYFLPRVGKPSSRLAAQHRISVGQIGRTTEGAVNAATAGARRRGNVGRARGDAWRLRLGGQEALNRENLGYGSEQEAYLRQAALDAENALMGVSGGANQGANMIASLTGQKGMAGASKFGALADIGGKLEGDWRANQLYKQPGTGTPPDATAIPDYSAGLPSTYTPSGENQPYLPTDPDYPGGQIDVGYTPFSAENVDGSPPVKRRRGSFGRRAW